MEKPQPPQSDHAVFSFGRMNPIHMGHKKLIDAMVSHAWKEGADHHVFLSHTHDSKKNPLTHKQKVHFAKKMFPHTNIHDEANIKNPLEAVEHLHKQGYKKITMMTGEDRQKEFHNLLHKYKPEGTHIEVLSAGHRDPDAEGVEGMSASKMREHAVKKNFSEFKKAVPNPEHAKEMYHAVRKGMRLENFQKHFKALFLVGGPGSGKDFIITTLLENANLVELPLDKYVQRIEEQTNIDVFDNYPSLIINGNADNLDKINIAKQVLECMGYDTAMIYVYTTNEESKYRNDERLARQAKTFSEEVRHEKYIHSVQNLHNFATSFGSRFHIFDNSFNIASVTENRRQEIMGWLEELGTYTSQFFETIVTVEASKIWIMENTGPGIDISAKTNRSEPIGAVDGPMAKDYPKPKKKVKEEAEPPSATNNIYHMYPAKPGKKRTKAPKKEPAKSPGNYGDKNIGNTPSLSGFGGMFNEEMKKKVKDRIKIKNKGEKQATPPPGVFDSRMGMVPSGGEGLVSTFSEGEKTFSQLRKNMSAITNNVDKE